MVENPPKARWLPGWLWAILRLVITMSIKKLLLNTKTVAILVTCVSLIAAFAMAASVPSLDPFNIRFNAFALIDLASAAISLGLFLFFVSKTARTEERIWLAVYFLSVSIFAG